MEFNRWYDKYPNLKSLLTLLEQVSDENIEPIAQDFLQIILQKYGSNFDAQIEKLNKNAPVRYKRWYDQNYNLHTCIEFVKTLDEDERNEMIDLFIMSIMSFVTNVDQG